MLSTDACKKSKIAQLVSDSFREGLAGYFDTALLHACIAVDATSRKVFPSDSKVGSRYVRFLRNYYWILEPMIGGGIDLSRTRFSNVDSLRSNEPDFADLIYNFFRCNLAHGEEIPPGFRVTLSSAANSLWVISHNVVRVPNRVLWALLSVVIMAKANSDLKTDVNYFLYYEFIGLSYHIWKLPVNEWWGKKRIFDGCLISMQPTLRALR